MLNFAAVRDLFAIIGNTFCILSRNYLTPAHSLHHAQSAFEKLHGRDDGRIICGVDEVGRGPLAGPVIAAAAILPASGLPRKIMGKIQDSKKLNEAQREDIYPYLIESCIYAVAEASVAEIGELNILWASMLAMQRAVDGLSTNHITL